MENTKSPILPNVLIFLGLALVVARFWDLFKSPVLFVVTLGILVFIHEWGHFIAAKSVGVHVYEFALGFGPKILTYMRRGGTEYTIRLFPIGGFVNPKGMQPEDPITADGINGRRPAERALVYLAGPLMNVVLCVVVLTMRGMVAGAPDPSTVLVLQIVERSAATRLTQVTRNGQPVTGGRPGLQIGDHLLAVNGKPVNRQDVVTTEIHDNLGKPVLLKLKRDGATLELSGIPERQTLPITGPVITKVPAGSKLDVKPDDQIDTIDGKSVVSDDVPTDVRARQLITEAGDRPVEVKLWRGGDTVIRTKGVVKALEVKESTVSRVVGILGFRPGPGTSGSVGFVKSAEMGMTEVVSIFQGMVSIFSQPKKMASGENVGGPIMIFKVLHDVGRLPLFYYLSILASLSMSLAFFNLLPIPVLDGGHILLLFCEVLRRRRLEPEMQRTVQWVGLAIILVIFFLITTKDIRGLLHG